MHVSDNKLFSSVFNDLQTFNLEQYNIFPNPHSVSSVHDMICVYLRGGGGNYTLLRSSMLVYWVQSLNFLVSLGEERMSSRSIQWDPSGSVIMEGKSEYFRSPVSVKIRVSLKAFNAAFLVVSGEEGVYVGGRSLAHQQGHVFTEMTK